MLKDRFQGNLNLASASVKGIREPTIVCVDVLHELLRLNYPVNTGWQANETLY
jgi:hypothetical protein